jgi:AcrR family transcriptional regulator
VKRARQTRRRIVGAASTLFVERGYGATTLDQVAKQAGVAVQTVYFHFGNKATLLKQALDLAAVGDDEPVALLDRPWFDQLKEEPDPARILELWVANSRSILERIAPIMTVIRGTMGSDPDLAAQWHINEQQRRTAYRALADLLNDRHLLKPGLDVQEASELAFLIVSVEGYFLATATLAWTPDRWEQTVVSLLITALTAAPR